jgi:N-acyl-D-amino-acid deacylase
MAIIVVAKLVAAPALAITLSAAMQNVHAANAPKSYDVIIHGGHVVDGTGNPWYAADVGIRGDKIQAIGRLDSANAKQLIDATGYVVAPGFIDMLGQSGTSLLIDNRSLSKLSQGITTEITGEGRSVAPQDARTLGPNRFHLIIDWTDLNGYFRRLEKVGTPLNFGTYVGAAQVREAVIGDDDRAPTPAELAKMKTLVAQAMQQGAMGVSSALIYAPGHYAKTTELVALAQVASQYGGIYATHIRSEGLTETAAMEEAIQIGRAAHLQVEIFHLKVIGKTRWGSMPKIVARIQAARKSGVNVAADMYPYTAGATALAACLPPWVADGGKLLERLRDRAVRQKIKIDLKEEHRDWENLYLNSGGATGVMISRVVNPELKKYEGKTVAAVAAEEQKDALDVLFDFILADNAQTRALYFFASEKDLRYGLKQRWTSIGLDAGETSLDGPLFAAHVHPRAWGSMPRFLGRYVRDRHLLPLTEAIRKITSLPAEREHLAKRGLLRPGYFADITVFDAATIIDKATYEEPNQVSEGVHYVFVNGQLEYKNGKLTGATAGRVLRGPGWRNVEVDN